MQRKTLLSFRLSIKYGKGYGKEKQRNEKKEASGNRQGSAGNLRKKEKQKEESKAREDERQRVVPGLRVLPFRLRIRLYRSLLYADSIFQSGNLPFQFLDFLLPETVFLLFR